jgi:salicylate hydroxylase/6-hydroxynicotinate 3-monooxygenase
MSGSKLQIGVAGASVGGMIAAAALRHVGVKVLIYRHAEHFIRVGAGIAMSASPNWALTMQRSIHPGR